MSAADIVRGILGASPWEMLGAATGFLSVFLMARQSVWGWPAGIVCVSAYAWVFGQSRLYANMALQFVFLSLTVLFFLLAYGDATSDTSLKVFTGFEGIICGFSAIYTGLAQVLNEVYGKTILPLGPMKK